MAATAIWMRHSSRSPARCVNSTALAVVRDAQKRTRFVSPAQINTEMMVTTTPQVNLNGKLSKDKSKQNAVMNFMSGPDGEVNAAMMIVISRMQTPGINQTTGRPNFNLLTGNRWALARPNFSAGKFTRAYGESGAAMAKELFWAWVKDKAEQMVRARRSSSKFLLHSWAAIIQKLLPFASDGGGMGDYGMSRSVLLSGEVSPAKEGSALAVCRVDNTIGMDSGNSVMDEKHNAAAHRVLVPALEAAIKAEFQDKMEKMNAKEWAKDEPELRLLGCHLT